MITYNINEYDKYLMLQNTLRYRFRFEVLDSNMKIINTVEGVIDGGSNSVDSSSNVRRTLSVTCVPTYFYDSNMILDPDGYIWLDKTIHFYIGIQDVRTKKYTYYSAGYYYYTDVGMQYDTETNQINLNMSDFMIVLDGTKNGQLSNSGAETTVFPAYEEDEDTGRPLKFYKIRDAMIVTLLQLTRVRDFLIDEIGEPKCMPRFNKNYLRTRKERKNKWDSIPYDLEFGAGSSIYDIISSLRDLYPNYETFFEPINNAFVCQMIPSHEDDPIYLDNDFFQRIIISEDISTNLTSVRNVCEIWGETIEADYFADSSSVENAFVLIKNQYTEQLARLKADLDELYLRYIRTIYDSNSAEAHELKRQIEAKQNEYYELDKEYQQQLVLLGTSGSITDYAYVTERITTFPDNYKSGDIIAVRILQPNVSEKSYLQVRTANGVLGAIPIFRPETDKFIKPMTLEANTVYCFRIEQHVGSETLPPTIAYLLGQWQVHALDALSNGDTSEIYVEKVPSRDSDGSIIFDANGQAMYHTRIPKDKYGNQIKMYSEEYFRYKYNCEHVHLTIAADSPFVVQKLGEIVDVRSDSDAGNSDSDYLALINARYINWQNSRLTDTVTIQTLLVPFLDVNMKVSYKPQRSNEEYEYVIKNISHDLSSMVSSITMYRFYPLLNEDISGVYENS